MFFYNLLYIPEIIAYISSAIALRKSLSRNLKNGFSRYLKPKGKNRKKKELLCLNICAMDLSRLAVPKDTLDQIVLLVLAIRI